MSWTGKLVEKTGADLETGVRLATALAAVGTDPDSRDELRALLTSLQRADLVAVVDGADAAAPRH